MGFDIMSLFVPPGTTWAKIEMNLMSNALNVKNLRYDSYSYLAVFYDSVKTGPNLIGPSGFYHTNGHILSKVGIYITLRPWRIKNLNMLCARLGTFHIGPS